eukprot:TRINITY_DN19461_c0_g1_i1.p1 TRINITY_DN19461_c0_g1~~TRINITY_DN19461_c0_g1_i1.p1  ORF type:complete len:604 (+),score=190.14 TRINITY_DN19461_c0_g1_i1:55-1812(+)
MFTDFTTDMPDSDSDVVLRRRAPSSAGGAGPGAGRKRRRVPGTDKDSQQPSSRRRTVDLTLDSSSDERAVARSTPRRAPSTAAAGAGSLRVGSHSAARALDFLDDEDDAPAAAARSDFVDVDADAPLDASPAPRKPARRRRRAAASSVDCDFLDEESDGPGGDRPNPEGPFAEPDDQDCDPITEERLKRGQFITIHSPDGSCRLSYNVSTMISIARANGSVFLQPPHFREPMCKELFEACCAVLPVCRKVAQVGVRNRNVEVVDVDNDGDQNFAQRVYLDRLHVFNFGDRLNKKVLHCCPVCWTAAAEMFSEDHGGSDSSGSGVVARTKEGERRLERMVRSCKGENLRQREMRRSLLKSDFGQERYGAAGSETDDDSSDSSMRRLPRRARRRKAQKRRARRERRRQAALVDDSSSSDSFDSLEFAGLAGVSPARLAEVRARRKREKRTKVSEAVEKPTNPLRVLWGIADRDRMLPGLLFPTAASLYRHVRDCHPTAGADLPDTELRDMIVTYVEGMNRFIERRIGFDHKNPLHHSTISPSLHSFWMRNNRYNTMRYNSMVSTVMRHHQEHGMDGTDCFHLQVVGN